MEKYIVTRDQILLMSRVAATLEVGAALETEMGRTSGYGKLLKELAADIYDCILFDLDPCQENIQAPEEEKNIPPENKELPEFSQTLPICEIELHPLDMDNYDTEALQLFMHRYPNSRPELQGEYLILDRNKNYHIAYLGPEHEFVDSENDYLPYPKDFVKGWLAIY